MNQPKRNWRHSQWYLRLKSHYSSLPFVGSTEGAIYGTVGCLALLALCSPIIVVILILIFG